MVDEQNRPLDANSRLKSRLRPTVPPRNTSALRRQPEEEEGDEVVPVVRFPEPTLDLTSEPAPEKKQKAKTPKAEQKNSPPDRPQKLLSFTLRVDESIDNGLRALCSNERITKETFLEAAYLACQEDDRMMQQILDIAKARRQKRRAAGVLRRAKAMAKYLE